MEAVSNQWQCATAKGTTLRSSGGFSRHSAGLSAQLEGMEHAATAAASVSMCSPTSLLACCSDSDEAARCTLATQPKHLTATDRTMLQHAS
jgi:hypothetical protein